MADNLVGNENIAFTDDFNIVLIDPNTVLDSSGMRKSRTIKQENLVMYANLEAKPVPRTKLAIGEDVETGVNTVNIGRINFLKPKDKDSLDTSYTDEFTGARSTQGAGVNQIRFGGDGNPQVPNYVDTQILGIRDISVDIKFNGVPVVNMTLVDVQGKSLFQTGGNSPYSVFLYYPYPMFLLTLKGFYGKAVQYKLMLLNFQADFEASTGNYIVNLKFIARTSAILDDIRLGYLYALPHMYNTYSTTSPEIPETSSTGTASVQSNGVGQTQELTVTRGSKGYSKIQQVFQRYKDKGLIDQDVPTITINEMSIKLQKYTEFLNREFEKLDFTNIVALTRYQESLENFRSEIIVWGEQNLQFSNPNLQIILGGVYKGLSVYPLSQITNVSQNPGVKVTNGNTAIEAEEKLNAILQKNLSIFQSVPGQSAKSITINQNDFTVDVFKLAFTEDDIDFVETYRRRTGRQVDSGFELFKEQIINELTNNGSFTQIDPPQTTRIAKKTAFYYTLQAQLNNIKNIRGQIEQKKKDEEERLNRIVRDKIKTNGNVQNLTFRPTVRNVIGVLMASVDAFYQLMDDVHVSAWNKKDDPARIKAIIKDVPSQEGKNAVQTTRVQNKNLFVFPWPQFVEKKEINGKVEYEVIYPGANDVKETTQAFDSSIWPEVEFVEEYLTAVIQKDRNFNTDVLPNDNLVLRYTPEHAIELPFKNVVYQQQNNPPLNFIYEIYERLYLNIFYSGLFHINANANLEFTASDIENNNIIQSQPDGPLNDILKETLTQPGQTLYNFLSSSRANSSGGTLWNAFISQDFITPYIKNLVQNSFQLLSPKDFLNTTTNPTKLESLTNISKFVKDTKTNELSIFDTFPFRLEKFAEKMDGKPNRDNRYTTINTYEFDEKKLVLTNFTKKNILPLTRTTSSTFSYDSDDTVDTQQVASFYENRKANQNYLEGNVKYTSDPNIGINQSTSILNTPYFINAIIETAGTSPDRYNTLSYLFLNSLPLSTLHERYINTENGTTEDYLFAPFNKFSAVHKMPYAWVLKMGSVWYRYKKYINDNVDILDSVWKSFDADKAYDPITNSKRKIYKIPYSTGDGVAKPFQLLGTEFIQSGFYPLVINNFFKLLTDTDFFVNNSNNLTYNLDTITSKVNDLTIKSSSNKVSNLNGPVTSWYVYLNITNDYTPYFSPKRINHKLLFPSAGYLPFQQTYYELRQQGNLNNIRLSEVSQLQPMYDGSVRSFWNSPNFGWFNTAQIKKPTPFEYMKYVDPSASQQADFSLGQNYSSIEDLFGVFTKEQLDLFETEFLEFSKKGGASKVYKPESDDTNYSNIFSILNKMFILNTTETEISKLSEVQNSKISETINKFLQVDVYVKIGNPKKFDRQKLGYFTNNSKFKPLALPPAGLTPYGPIDKLPNPGLTVQESQTLYKDEWKALYQYVGFSTLGPNTPDGLPLSYSENSAIYEFFRDNDIAFTKESIEYYSQIIRIYATQKYINSNYNRTNFENDVTETLSKLETKRETTELMFRRKLGALNNTKSAELSDTGSRLDGDIIKLEQWELFKAINDKWVSGRDFENNLLFEEFLFFDRANRDIGDELIINTDTIRKYCSWDNASTSIMSLIREILSNNRMNFFVMPAYINFYGQVTPGGSKSGQRRDSIVNNANDVFGVYNYVDFTNFSSKFLCQYVDRPSQTLSLDQDPNYPFRDDSFDLGNPANNPIRQTEGPSNFERNNKAVGFVVDFGTMNQSVFKSVDINQQQGVSSSEQIQATIDLGNQSSGKKTMQQTTALYEFYKNRSYNCTVKTLGNVMIQPTMYFVLRHIPMFNGTYMIRNVKHTISPGSFDTVFEGQRISANINTRITDDFASVNEDFTKKLDDKVKEFVSNNKLVTFDEGNNQFLDGDQSKQFFLNGFVPYNGFISQTQDVETQDCFENVNTKFGNITGATLLESSELPNQIAELLKRKFPSDRFTRLYLFCLLYLQGYDADSVQIPLTFKQNNIYGVNVDIDFPPDLCKLVTGYRCLKSVKGVVRPYANFNSLSENIDFMSGFYSEKTKQQFRGLQPTDTEQVIDKIVELFFNTWYTSGPTEASKYNTDANQYLAWIDTTRWSLTQGILLGL